MSIVTKSILSAGVLTAMSFSLALAGPVEERKELMKTVVKNVKIAVPMAKGEQPYDAAAAKEAMQAINAVPDKFVKLFPEGSHDHPETEASPKIWENMSDFMSKAENLKQASAETAAAADKGHDAFKAAVFDKLLKTCGACHDAYRIKKN